MPKVTFIIDGERQTVEFEHGKLPYSHHGMPESFLDVAKNLGVPLEHACGGSCACTTCHVIIREGEQNLSEMQDDEADRLDTAWDLTTQLAARLPGGHQGRRRLRAADVHAQLRAGRRRHPARQVRTARSAKDAGGARREVDRRGRHRHRARREVSRRRSADGPLHRPARAACWRSTASTTIRRRRTSRSSRPSRWPGTKNGRTTS